jgi:hypothetical protein
MKQSIPILALLLLALGSCNTKRQFPDNVLGYAPIYSNDGNNNTISVTAAASYENPGKIYKYGNYSFQMDNGKGIHIINSTDPNNPQKIKFIQVAGCTDISIKNNSLYTNNFRDLVTLNIADINNITETARTTDVFPMVEQITPPVAGVYFECVDETKGTVISWTQKNIENPKCYRP